MGHEGPLFANWAIQVVDAFGLDSFPTYQPRPPIIREENADNKARQEVLTSFDDPIQAGFDC
jgi:hypothetical protein